MSEAISTICAAVDFSSPAACASASMLVMMVVSRASVVWALGETPAQNTAVASMTLSFPSLLSDIAAPPAVQLTAGDGVDRGHHLRILERRDVPGGVPDEHEVERDERIHPVAEKMPGDVRDGGVPLALAHPVLHEPTRPGAGDRGLGEVVAALHLLDEPRGGERQREVGRPPAGDPG